MRVLSLNAYTMGHVTHQNVLEKTFPDFFSGIDFYSLHLTDYFKKDFLARIVHLLLRQRLPVSTSRDYDFYRFRLELGNSFFTRRLLRSETRGYQPDLLHIHTQSIALLSADLLRKIPTVISIDCTTALLAVHHPFPASMTYRPIIALEKQCFQRAKHVVSCSEWARQSVIRDYGISPERVTHIPYGMPLDIFLEIPRSLCSHDRKPRLLFVGNDFARKGGYDLLAVYLKYFVNTCELDIVTNAAMTGIDGIDSIQVHKGVQPMSPELLHLYQNADIFVLPTREDVYGVVYIEAMAAGLPCVGTNIMAVSELIRDGETGFTISPGNQDALYQALGKLVADPHLRLSMGLAGRTTAIESFDAQRNCQKLLQIFSNIIAF